MATAVEPDYVRIKDNQKLDHLPGDYGKFLLGHTFEMLDEPFKVFEEKYQRYGSLSRANFTFQKMVVVTGPEYIKLLTLDKEQIFSPRMGYDGPLKDFFRGGLLMRDFGEHKIHRRIMQTAFKTDSMRNYVGDMNRIIAEQLEEWDKQGDFRFYPNIKTLLLDLAAKVFLGMDLNGPETKKLNDAFLTMMNGAVAMIRKDIPFLSYGKAMKGRRYLEKFFMESVPKWRESDGRDMASFFSKETDDQGELFDDKVVAEHLIFLMLAAHDTTTSALTMGASFLARHQDWQQRLREEFAELGKDQLDYDDLSKLENAEHVFHEILRLHPPVPSFSRRTVADTEINGHAIPAHTLIQVSTLHTMRMEEWWPNPHNFDPGRFARNEHKNHPFQWAPFGGGAHKCIGLHFADMLYKCVITQLLAKYRLRFVDDYQYPAPVQHFPFAKPKDDMPLILERI